MNNDNETPGEDPEGDALDTLLAAADLGIFPDDIQTEVDAVLAPGQSLEPESRRRLIAAASRATRDRALHERAALETLLYETRRKHDRSVQDLSAATGLDPLSLRAIDRGELQIDSCDAASVAAWTLALSIGRDSVAGTLRRSLGRRAGEPAYAGERDLRLSQEQAQFIDDVLREFDEQTGRHERQ